MYKFINNINNKMIDTILEKISKKGELSLTFLERYYLASFNCIKNKK